MDYKEDEYLMLSGIQHFKFCRRQWALIHIEQQWEENVKTVEGNHLHKKADQPFVKEKRGDKVIVRGMPVLSHALKITGICDVVEFIQDLDGVEIQGLSGKYTAYPVEYKRGKPKADESDILQMTAQAMCLEEMLMLDVQEGYLFYGETKRRLAVAITSERRETVMKMVEEMQLYYGRNHTPKVKTGSFCNSCSLKNICLPELMNKESAKSYIERKIFE